MAGSMWKKLMAVVIACTLPVGAFGTIGITAAEESEFDALRAKWTEVLTGGAGYDPSDPDIAEHITELTESVKSFQASMERARNRTYPWEDLSKLGNSALLSTAFNRISQMAQAYRTRGCELEGDPALLKDTRDALKLMLENRYNAQVEKYYDNWWDWEIGCTRPLMNAVLLIYDELDQATIDKAVAAIDRFVPDPTKCVEQKNVATGANLIWVCQAVALRGIAGKDAAKIEAAKNALTPVFAYVVQQDGFYEDGSFIQHSMFAYTGGYGKSLINELSQLMYLLGGSSWAVTDPSSEHIYEWIYNSYEPLIYKGQMMDMVNGRELSRNSVSPHTIGKGVITGLVFLAQFAPEPHRSAFADMVKTWVAQNTYSNFYADSSPFIITKAREIASSAGERTKYDGVKLFAAMDRAVMQRDNFAYGLAMYSTSRTASYEAINNENLKGYYTAAGALYLYNDDFAQFADGYWASVDLMMLPGTTAAADRMEKNAAKNGSNFAGGAVLDNYYGAMGFRYQPSTFNLDAKKSYFMFDDELVALGTVNPSSGDSAYTVIDNRKVEAGQELTVDGELRIANVGESESVDNVKWMHLSGRQAGSDIGYYMPEPVNVCAVRELREVDWKTINARYNEGELNGQPREFVKLSVNHRANLSDQPYCYVLLPGKSVGETKSYSENPGIEILANEYDVHAVRESTLGITAANFWEQNPQSAGGITVDKPCSVIMQHINGELTVVVADPTQEVKDTITVQIERPGAQLVSADENVAASVDGNVITLTVDAAGKRGMSSGAKFTAEGGAAAARFADVPLSHWAYPYVEELAQTGVVSGVDDKHFKPDGNVTREQFAKMLMGGYTLSGEYSYSDVDPNAWYAPYVGAASRLGVINGYEDGTFGVGKLITRQEMAAMVYRLCTNLNFNEFPQSIAFTDQDAIAGWAREAVNAMQRAGILSGDTDGAFHPEDNATRAQAAKVICVMKQLQAQQVQ